MDARAALLEGLVDYAGLFPPASLDLPTALRRFDAHQRGKDARLLGRFVLPAGRLTELEPWLHGPWLPERPLPLSMLATIEDLPAVAAFQRDRRSVLVQALELRVPERAIAAWLDQLAVALADAALADREAYIELPVGRDDEVLAALGARQADPPARRLAAKLRCGGVTADLVPSAERVAAVLAAARDHGVPLKFTAGLHHPVRGMDQTEGVPMHGFLNVYAAALFAHVHGLPAADLMPVLLEEDPRAFRLDRGSLAWRDRVAAGDAVARLRESLLAGYGSCSFDEPVTDLRSLALLV